MERCVEGIIKRSAASIVSGIGFGAANGGALDLLSLVLSQYLNNLCKCVQSFAELGLRDNACIVDAYQCFRYLGFDFADIFKYISKGTRLKTVPGPSTADTLENEEDLFLVDKFPYTYMKESTLHDAPNPPFPFLPPLHTYMHTPIILKNPTHKMIAPGKDSLDINLCIHESLVRYVTKVIKLSSAHSGNHTSIDINGIDGATLDVNNVSVGANSVAEGANSMVTDSDSTMLRKKSNTTLNGDSGIVTNVETPIEEFNFEQPSFSQRYRDEYSEIEECSMSGSPSTNEEDNGFTVDSSGKILLNLEVGLFPINYELSFGSKIRRNFYK